MANERGTPVETAYEPPHPAEVLEAEQSGKQLAKGTARGRSSAANMREVDTQTGEERMVPSVPGLPGQTPLALRDETFNKVATKAVTKTQALILQKPIDERKEADILPTGELYMSHVFMRRRLNKAFNPMGWAIRPLGNIAVDPVTNVMYREYALIINGVIVAAAFGSTKYQVANARQDYADAAEAVRSNALTRCCKDLGIGSECWDRQWCELWKDKFAVHVWVCSKSRDGSIFADHYWRKKEAKPFRGEIARVVGTPNAESKTVKNLPFCANFNEAKTLYTHQTTRGRATPPAPGQDQPVHEQTPDRTATERGGDSTAARNPEKGATETNDLPPGSTVKGRVDPALAPYVVRECKVADKSKETRVVKGDPAKTEPTWTLYLITMHDGTEYTTFSSSVYATAQKMWAQRRLVEIDFEKKKITSGKQAGKLVKNVTNIQPYEPKPREPGEEG